MKIASGQAAGNSPSAELAVSAVNNALSRAGLEQAGAVMLFLTRDFQRHPEAALLAAARAAGSMEISGATAYGLITEEGWLLDQSGAVALVIETSATNSQAASEHCLSLTGHSTLPFDWQTLPARAGMLSSNAAVWHHARPQPSGNAELHLKGFTSRLAISTGLCPLGGALRVDACRSYDLLSISGQKAVDTLRRSLPGERRQGLALHHLVAVRQQGGPGIAILAANDDGSLTMAEPFIPGETMHWAIRRPLSAEQEMNETLKAAVNGGNQPNFAVMFSCIGRGPLFYGDDDRDLAAFRRQLPKTPLIGAYGGGQIAPSGTGNRLYQNAVMTLLFESADV